MNRLPIRAAEVVGDAAHIPLTRGLYAVVDANDLPKVSKSNWYAMVQKRNVYAAATVDGKTIYMHRLISGASKDLLVDHKNSNGLDNRSSNLRVASAAQNQYNARPMSAKGSGIKGVSWCKKRKKWRAAIQSDGIRKWLGAFDALDEAAKAYAIAAAATRGDFGVSI